MIELRVSRDYDKRLALFAKFEEEQYFYVYPDDTLRCDIVEMAAKYLIGQLPEDFTPLVQGLTTKELLHEQIKHDLRILAATIKND